MKKFFGSKSFTLLLGGLSLLALVYLTAALSSFRFRPAEIYYYPETPTPRVNSLPIPVTTFPWQPLVIWAALLVVLVALFLVLLDREQRKRFLKALLRILVLAVTVLLVANRFGNQILVPKKGTPEAAAALGPNLSPGQRTSPPPFVPPHLPAWAIYLITLGILLALGGGIWLFFWLGKKRQVLQPLDELAQIASSSLESIQTGEDWENSIIQCYQRMSAVVNTRRKLSRQPAVTPTEFAYELELAGLPGEAVRRLTTLFERVRYGAKKTSRQDIHEAVDCLSTILHACHEAL